MKSLVNRSAIVTGAGRGLGREIAAAYGAAGANVLLCARSTAEVEAAADEAHARSDGSTKILTTTCDVADSAQVERTVTMALDAFGGLDILVNNAGILGPVGALEENDWGEWQRTMAVNLNGSVLPCRAVLPHMKSKGYGKIIQLSGGGATKPMPGFTAYAASKAAVVRFMETLAMETRASGIDVNAIAPGALNTKFLDEVLDAGPDRAGADYFAGAVKQKEDGGAPLEKGAALAVFLASAVSDGITGRLISAIWDDWDELPSRREQLEGSDIYTLRRILGRDRGFDWDR